MKKIVNTATLLLSRILAGLLALVGYGCSSSGDAPCMYGSPMGTFEAKGSVTAENGESTPVEAKVIFTHPDTPSTLGYNYAEGETSKNGQYEISGELSSKKLKVVCIPDDPNLEPDSTIVTLNFKKVTPERDFWVDMGHANVNVDFKLKEKKAEK